MYIVVIALVLCIAYLGYKNHTGRKGEDYLMMIVKAQNEDIENWTKTYAALEQGVDDIEDNYEQQFLTFEETIEKLKKDLAEADAYLEQHDRECLPLLHETRWQALSGSVENA